ncbi:hypothetical protein AJ80_05722 [Polytolypa hystricis UAMH7299]|uniref:C3H1-type domain-containing protein n=1 Tax=Polytolypa hystricis (strain UAMH7299) TaxID=1447883 RepID=A0A2B7Y1B4_POLH7|nr:hypothetical protein AJ80_05722 [Polytolypa hystricis UAMH7299]
MDPSTNPNPPSTAEPAPGPFQNDYWGNMNSIYSSTPPQPDQPFGIGWDHPVFQNSPRPQTQPPSQDIYSQQPQPEWQRNPLQPQVAPDAQQRYAAPAQYSLNQYQQPNPAFESHPAPNPSSYHQYPFEAHNNYYSNSPLPRQNGFAQQPTVELQQVNLPTQINTTQMRPTIPSYTRPATLQRDVQGNGPNLANGYHEGQISSTYQSTIDPQFLSAAQSSMMQPSIPPGEYYVINPADLEGPPDARTLAAYSENARRPFGRSGHGLNIAPHATQPVPTGLQPKQIIEVQIPLKPIKASTQQKKTEDGVKRKRGRPKKVAAKPVAKPDASDSSESNDSDSSSDLEVEPEPSPLPATRPSDLEGAVRYDTLKAVWSPRNKRPPISVVRNSMMLFSELVKGVRDTWKARSEALKAAENQNLEDKIPAVKKEVISQRRLLDLIVNTTLEFGHPSIFQRYGEHPIIVSAFYSFLLDRHTAADSDGSLTVSILKLMSKFITMDQTMLEKTKNDKILTRFVKKGGDIIKKLAQIILENAAEVTKRKGDSSKPSSKEGTPNGSDHGSMLSQVVVPVTRPDSVAGTKRPREPELADSIPTKRPVTPSNAKPISKLAPATQTAKKAVGSAQDAKSASTGPAATASKPKANIIVPKPPPSLFNSLMSASKKPGTSNAARAAAAAAAKEKANAATEPKETPSPAPAKPAFSFSETMADLSKPKEIVAAKPIEERAPETEEEREKRLRKEERRKLRVSWKPDDSLTEIRLFTHDPEEEIGHDESMIRDVDDVGGEGRTLKLHRDLDLDDEEDQEMNEESMFPYSKPCEIDFEELDATERARNFSKTGGPNTPNSPEKLAQEQREATTLSVFYTSVSDIPFSPKEPPAADPDEAYDPEVPFGEPEEYVKNRSSRYFAARAPPPTQPAQPVAPQPSAPATPAVDIASLLKIIQQTPQTQQQRQANNPPGLSSVFNQFSAAGQMPAMAQAAQVPQTSQPGGASQGGLDLQKILALMSAGQQMQQQSFPAAQASQPPNHLASLLSQFPAAAQQQQQPQKHQQSSQSSSYNYNQQQQQQHKSYYDESDSRKRGRDSQGNYDNYGNDGNGNGSGGGGGYNKRYRTNGDKPKKHPKAGLVPCRYWKEGKCLKGDDCTFRHDPLD